jgi:hypothetical protein
MANILKEHIVKEIRLENKDIEIMSPKIIAGYVMYKYKCSHYLAKQIAKKLTDVHSKTS